MTHLSAAAFAHRPATPVDARGYAHRSVDPTTEIPLGAPLVSPRLGFAHHGIYVGNGRVVHYAALSRSLRSGPVQEASLAVFANGRGVEVVTGRPMHYPPAVVVERARSRVGENRYRVATNNCEHFCGWCLRDQSRSEQIERLLRWPRVLAAVMSRVGQKRHWRTGTNSNRNRRSIPTLLPWSTS